MAFSSGTFSLYSPGNPTVSGTTISSTWANNTLSDIATGLSTCLLKDGTQTVTANLPMSGFKLTGLAAGASSGDSLRYEQVIGVMQPLATLTTKGDLYAATASATVTRIAVSATNGNVLMADSTQATGLNYGGRGGLLPFMANASVADGSTNYMGSSQTSTAEADVSMPVPFACTIKNLYAARSAGGAGTAAFTLRKNGSDTALTASATGAATTANDTSNSVSCAAGDLIDMKVVLSGGATTAVHKASVELVKTGT